MPARGRTSRRRLYVSALWTFGVGVVVYRLDVCFQGPGAGLGACCSGGISVCDRAAVPRSLAARVPCRVSRRARCRRRRGHCAGGVPVRGALARSVRPAPPVRSLAAPDRRQPRDRLGSRTLPTSRSRARRHPGRRRRSTAAAPRSRGCAGDVAAGAASSDRASPSARVDAGGDRRPPRPAARHRQFAAPPWPRPARSAAAGGAMSERQLQRALRTFVAPDEEAARERTWRLLSVAYAEREPLPQRRLFPLRLAVVVAVLALLAAAVLSPPGQAVLDTVREAIGIEQAQPALFSLPAPGSLIVASPESGAWGVHSDGSKRRLGDYREASWSPSGRFVGAARANELAALTPQGEVRWTLARPAVRFPRWGGTATDTRVAYLSRSRLHVVAGDGTGDADVRALPDAALVAPAWQPA